MNLSTKINMVLNNHLIATLPDFVRNFRFSEFWIKRKQFVRDMHPDKVYYWNQSLIDAFYKIKEWIEDEEKSSKSNLRESGLSALKCFLGGNLDLDSISITRGSKVDISSEIIILEPGQIVDFTSFKGEKDAHDHLRLHKLEVHGNSSSPARICIDGQQTCKLCFGEAAYITEVRGCCLEILPNIIRNSNYELSLISKDGNFYSTLVVQDLKSGSKKMLDGVTSFALVNDGYIYIDKGGRPIYMTSQIPKFMLKHDAKALYVKSMNDYVLVLYQDGILKTTQSMDEMSNVYFGGFNKNGSLIKK